MLVSVYNSNTITKESPLLKVRVTNLLDVSLGNAKVYVKSFVTSDERTTLFDNRLFVKSPENDDYIIVEGEVARGYFPANSYGVDISSVNPSRGMYKCEVKVELLNDQAQYIVKDPYVIDVKVLAKIAVEDVLIEIGEKDQPSKKHELQYVINFLLFVIIEIITIYKIYF